MGVAQTKAAQELLKTDIELSSHRLISLLMAGALERVEQAHICIAKNQDDDKAILVNKIVAILHGLQASLNYESGGEIAVNLGALYNYMLDQIEAADNDLSLSSALNEVTRLVQEIKAGWDEIAAEDVVLNEATVAC